MYYVKEQSLKVSSRMIGTDEPEYYVFEILYSDFGSY